MKNLAITFISVLTVVGIIYALQVENSMHATHPISTVFNATDVSSGADVEEGPISQTATKVTTLIPVATGHHDGQFRVEDSESEAGCLTQASASTISTEIVTKSPSKNRMNKILKERSVVQQIDKDREEAKVENSKKLLQVLIESQPNMEQVQEMIDGGYDVNAAHDEEGRSILHWAVINGDSRLVEKILDKDADVMATDNKGMTALHRAAAYGKLEAFKLILQRLRRLGYHDAINLQNEKQYQVTPLHFAAQNGHLNIVQFLIENGANIHSVASTGMTPLHFAAQNGHLNIVQFLIENGASMHAVTLTGITPKNLAIINLDYCTDNAKKLLDVIEYLMDHESKCASKTTVKNVTEQIFQDFNEGQCKQGTKIVDLLKKSIDVSQYVDELSKAGVAFIKCGIFWQTIAQVSKRRGWKIHVSPKPEFVKHVLKALESVLKDINSSFKIVDSLETYENSMMVDEFQIGKFITIYPNSDEQAFEIAQKINQTFQSYKMTEDYFVDIKNDFKVYPGVYTRLCHYYDEEDSDSRYELGIPETVFSNYVDELGTYEEIYEHPFKDGLFIGKERMPENVREISKILIAKQCKTWEPLTDLSQIIDCTNFVMINALAKKQLLRSMDEYVAIAKITDIQNNLQIFLVPNRQCCLNNKSIGKLMKDAIPQLLQCFDLKKLQIKAVFSEGIEKGNISYVVDPQKFLKDLDKELPEYQPKYYEGYDPAFKLIKLGDVKDTDMVVASYKVMDCIATNDEDSSEINDDDEVVPLGVKPLKSEDDRCKVIAMRRVSENQIQLLEIPSDINLYKPRINEFNMQVRFRTIDTLIAFLRNPTPKVPVKICLKLASCEPHPLREESIIHRPIEFLEEVQKLFVMKKVVSDDSEVAQEDREAIARKMSEKKQYSQDLLKAVQEKKINIGWIKDLLENRADVNVRDKQGFTALHYAAQDGKLDVIRELLEHGADVDIEDDNNNTALQIAQINEQEEIVDFLQGAKMQKEVCNMSNEGIQIVMDILNKLHCEKLRRKKCDDMDFKREDVQNALEKIFDKCDEKLIQDWFERINGIYIALSENLNKAVKKLEKMPKCISITGKTAVVGDIHGYNEDLQMIIENLRMQLVEKKISNVVFLGDIIDRGPNSTISMLRLLEFFNSEDKDYKDHVYILRGNHETIYDENISALKRELGLYKNQELFLVYIQQLPILAVVNNEVLLVHAGISKIESVIDFFKGNKFLIGDDKLRFNVITDALWSVLQEPGYIPGWRGLGWVYGVEDVKNFFDTAKQIELEGRKLDLKYMIRGHGHEQGPFSLISGEGVSVATVISSGTLVNLYRCQGLVNLGYDHNRISWPDRKRIYGGIALIGGNCAGEDNKPQEYMGMVYNEAGFSFFSDAQCFAAGFVLEANAFASSDIKILDIMLPIKKAQIVDKSSGRVIEYKDQIQAGAFTGSKIEMIIVHDQASKDLLENNRVSYGIRPEVDIMLKK